jgi:hypothetical protein
MGDQNNQLRLTELSDLKSTGSSQSSNRCYFGFFLDKPLLLVIGFFEELLLSLVGGCFAIGLDGFLVSPFPGFAGGAFEAALGAALGGGKDLDFVSGLLSGFGLPSVFGLTSGLAFISTLAFTSGLAGALPLGAGLRLA